MLAHKRKREEPDKKDAGGATAEAHADEPVIVPETPMASPGQSVTIVDRSSTVAEAEISRPPLRDRIVAPAIRAPPNGTGMVSAAAMLPGKPAASMPNRALFAPVCASVQISFAP